MSAQKRTGKTGVRWLAVVDGQRDAITGRRRQLKKTFETKRDAERWERETRAAIDRGDYLEPSTATVAEYLRQWLGSVANLRPATRDRYERVVRNQLIPPLGAIPLAKLTPLHVQHFYAGLLADGLSSTTVALYHGILHHALDQAVKWRLIPRNVCDAVDAPRPQNPEMRTWTPEQARTFLAATADDSLAAFWRLALNTGMRRGELLALRWDDLDLDRATLAVRRTLTRGADGLVFGEPKTRSGKRAIALPASCVTALREHRRRQLARRLELGPAWHDTDLVFERGDGRVLHPNVSGRAFRRLVAELGLPAIRFHDLRHTAATLMLANGEHPKVVQERLGHNDISMTLNRYSHVTMDMQREAANRLDALLGS